MDYIKYIISITAFSGVVIFIVKQDYVTILNSGLEKFKSKLSKEVEDFKSELKIKEIERNITFNKLHEERAVVLKTLYKKSLDINLSMLKLTHPAQGKEWFKNFDSNIEVDNVLKDYCSYYMANLIYLNKDLGVKIEKFLDKCHRIETQMATAKRNYNFNKEINKQSIKTWSLSFDSWQHDLRYIQEDLVEEFRKLLGVN
ncbi:hypothetical protein ACTS9E_04405 [Empedobacter brevis]